jgi:flagellar basal body-associated protein FliL
MAEKEAKKDDHGAKKDAKDGEKKAAGGMGALLTKTPVLLGGVMVVEAVVLILGLKMLGFGAAKDVVAAELAEQHDEVPADEAASHGEDEGAAEGDGKESAGHGDAKSAGGGKEAGKEGESSAPAKKFDRRKPYELPVVEFRAPNKMSGRTFLYDISIYAVVKGEHANKVEAALKAREALIKDRIRTIIAQSDPEKLGGGSEPGLETLRRQVKYQLDEVVGEGLIDEVLVPRCIPFRTDY